MLLCGIDHPVQELFQASLPQCLVPSHNPLAPPLHYGHIIVKYKSGYTNRARRF